MIQTIAFIGDSITNGYGVAPEQAFRTLVVEQLNDNGIPCEGLNMSYNGASTATLNEIAVGLLTHERPNIAVITLGINDAGLNVSWQTIMSNLDKAIFKFTTNNCKVILGKVDPSYIYPPYGDQLKNIYAALKSKYPTLYFFDFINTAILSNETIGDHLHPNAVGHQTIVNNLLPVLSEVLNGNS